MSMVIDEHGTFLGKRGRSLYVKPPDGKPTRRSTYNLTDVIVLCNCSISSQAIELLAQNGIPLVFMKRGRPYALLHPFFNHGTVHTRREQISAYWDHRGVHLATAFAMGAIINKRRLLEYLSRNRMKSNPPLADELTHLASSIRQLEDRLDFNGPSVESIRTDLMTVEAQAARKYFTGLRKILPKEFGFRGREKRPSTDPVNSMLSYGYAVLYSRVLTAIAACGLEPFAGFLHSDRSGKPSLVLDLVEEFRQVTVDRTVVRLLMQRKIRADMFRTDTGRVLMDTEARRTLLTALLGTLDSEVRGAGKRPLQVMQVMMHQARALVRYLLGKEKEYRPYMFRW